MPPTSAASETNESPEPEPDPAPLSWAEHTASTYARIVCNGQSSSPNFEGLKSHAMQFLLQLGPRDGIEEMLVAQMLWTQARIAFLNRCSVSQKTPVYVDLFHASADRAAGTFQRQMTALLQYRRPPRKRRSNSFTSIRTAHINAQQVVNPAVPLPHSPHALPKNTSHKAHRPPTKIASPQADPTA